jgi:hypothetical protein
MLFMEQKSSQNQRLVRHAIMVLGKNTLFLPPLLAAEMRGPRSRIIKARGQGAYALAKAQGLTLDVNGPPYPRHVDIIGWSSDKDAQLMAATEIVEKLQLIIDPRRSTVE